MNPQLLSYITQRRQAGIGDEQIKQELRTSGWAEADIAGVFGPAAPAPVVRHARRWWIPLVVIAILLVAGGIGYAVFHTSDSTPAETATPSVAVSPSVSISGGTSGDLCGQLSSSDEAAIFGDATIIQSKVTLVPPSTAYSKFCLFYYLIRAGENQIAFHGTVAHCATTEVCDTYRKLVGISLQTSGATVLGVGDVSSYSAVPGVGGTILDSTGIALFNSGYVINPKLTQKNSGADAAYNFHLAQQFTTVIAARFK